jgi:hypothetical protein
LSNQASSLELVIELVGERAAGLEVRLEIALQPLDDALRLRVGRLAEVPVDLQLAAEGGELARRPPAACVEARLAVPDERLGQGAERPEAAADPEQQVLGLLREHERA